MTDLYTPVFYTWCVRTFGNYTHLFWTVLEYLGCLHPRFSKPVGKNQCKEAREFWMCWVGSDFRQLEIYGNIYFGGSVTKVSDFIMPFWTNFTLKPQKSYIDPSNFLVESTLTVFKSGKTHHLRGVFICCFVKIGNRQVCWFFQSVSQALITLQPVWGPQENNNTSPRLAETGGVFWGLGKLHRLRNSPQQFCKCDLFGMVKWWLKNVTL